MSLPQNNFAALLLAPVLAFLSLLLFSANANAGETPANSNMMAVDLPQALSIAVESYQANSQKSTEENLLNNKAMLEKMGIAQSRVGKQVSSIQGKQAEPAIIASELSELPAVLKLINDALLRIGELQNPGSQQQNAISQGIIHTVPAFWLAVGTQASSIPVLRLKNQLKSQLEPFVQNKHSLSDKQAFQRDQLLNIVSSLKLLETEASRMSFPLRRQLGIANNGSGMLFINSPAIDVPELAFATEKLDEMALSAAPTSQADRNSVDIYLDQAGKNLPMQLPDDSGLLLWLSTGKKVAFDLYNLLDKLERSALLKQNKENTLDPNILISAAKLARARLAYFYYLKKRELFALNHCKKSTSELRNEAELDFITDSFNDQLEKLKQEQRSIATLLDYFQSYAKLQLAFSYLQNSVSQPANTIAEQFAKSKKSQSTAIFSCYLSDQQQAEKQKAIDVINNERDQALKLAEDYKAQLDAIAEAEKQKQLAVKEARSAWIRQQNPRHYTLQIKTGKNIESLQNYANNFKLGNNARVITTVTVKGQNQYTLVYGSYANQELAYIAQFKLPQTVQDQNNIWIRRFADIHRTLKPL